MPPLSSINRDFMRQVLKGEKALLPMAECKFVTVPMYDELSVKNIFPKFHGDSEIMKYLQDEYPKNRYPDRTYFFTILNTVHPEYVSNMIAHANNARYAPFGQAKEHDTVVVNEEWLDKLKKLPFYSSKFNFFLTILESRGRVLHLLKEKTKPVPK